MRTRQGITARFLFCPLKRQNTPRASGQPEPARAHRLQRTKTNEGTQPAHYWQSAPPRQRRSAKPEPARTGTETASTSQAKRATRTPRTDRRTKSEPGQCRAKRSPEKRPHPPPTASQSAAETQAPAHHWQRPHLTPAASQGHKCERSAPQARASQGQPERNGSHQRRANRAHTPSNEKRRGTWERRFQTI